MGTASNSSGNTVRKTIIALRSEIKKEVEQLASELKHKGKGDGTIHNTILFLLSAEFNLPKEFNPFSAKLKQESGQVLLNIPIGMFYAMHFNGRRKIKTKPGLKGLKIF
ncbi:MAG: hypothetical protein NTX03_09020 [Bacteroidetes bacterium]|nr:hypothetical protein [Bacteroidota bacterium]